MFPGLLMRPENDEADVRKCEVEAKDEAKTYEPEAEARVSNVSCIITV